jgi:hypothetical protein
MAVDFFKCEICHKTFPMSLNHEHHKIPKALGGKDTQDNLAQLDNACHNNLHAIAYMLVNQKRRAEIEPTLIAIFPKDLNAQKRMFHLSQLVAREMLLKKEIRKEPDTEIRTSVELPSRYLELIKLAGYDMPHKNGRKAGVSKIIRVAIAEFLAKKFPLRKQEILSLLKPSKGNVSEE